MFTRRSVISSCALSVALSVASAVGVLPLQQKTAAVVDEGISGEISMNASFSFDTAHASGHGSTTTIWALSLGGWEATIEPEYQSWKKTVHWTASMETSNTAKATGCTFHEKGSDEGDAEVTVVRMTPATGPWSYNVHWTGSPQSVAYKTRVNTNCPPNTSFDGLHAACVPHIPEGGTGDDIEIPQDQMTDAGSAAGQFNSWCSSIFTTQQITWALGFGVPPDGADLQLTVSGPIAAKEGEAFDLTYLVTNNGPLAAENVAWHASLFAETGPSPQIVTVSSSEFTCANAPVLACSLDGLSSGGSAAVRVRVGTTGPGTVRTNTAVSADTFDPVLANNEDTKLITIVANSKCYVTSYAAIAEPRSITEPLDGTINSAIQVKWCVAKGQVSVKSVKWETSGGLTYVLPFAFIIPTEVGKVTKTSLGNGAVAVSTGNLVAYDCSLIVKKPTLGECGFPDAKPWWTVRLTLNLYPQGQVVTHMDADPAEVIGGNVFEGDWFGGPPAVVVELEETVPSK